MSSRPPISPITDRVPIVGADGTPTHYFIRYLQERGFDTDSKVTPAQVEQLIQEWAAERDINVTSPITGGGPLSSDVTIGMANSGVTPGSYTNTNLTVDAFGRITTAANGSGGGGGGGWTKVIDWDFAIDGAVTNIVSSDLTGFNELMVNITNVPTSASTWRVVDFSADGGSTWLSDSNWGTASSSGTTNPPYSGGDNQWFVHSTASSAARTCFGLLWGMASRSPKGFRTARDNQGMWYETQAVNRCRVKTQNGTATFTGGNIEVWAS